MKKALLTSIVALPLMIGCTQSPTAPSITGLNNTAAPSATVLRWDVVAPGCNPQQAPSPLPDSSAAKVNRTDATSVTASWDYTTTTARQVTLYAKFHDVNGQWALCSWDTADV